ncbi:hypothetical protein [Methylobacterium oryzae]|uniref:hypothetical protein n=1 Tax=Methylobacterium oryzae TaxID=334852 RepID=UPI002F35720B
MTRPLFRPVGLPMLILAIPTTLAAQGLAPDQTGTGGGPASNTGSLGVTKPPGPRSARAKRRRAPCGRVSAPGSTRSSAASATAATERGAGRAVRSSGRPNGTGPWR